MPKSINVGPIHVSWGDDLLQDDQAFYGVSLSVTPFRWIALGLAMDRRDNHQRDERQRLWGVYHRLEALLWSRNNVKDPERGWVDTADVRTVLDGGDWVPLTEDSDSQS